jgi:uncharacterized membrane protein YoaK (UPF0700 family)
MTGNVIFLGFGIAGAGAISVWASLAALGAFLVGGVGGGRMGVRWASNRGLQLAVTTATELLLVAAAFVVAALSSDDIGTESRYAVIVLLAVAMGFQNATARKLAVPDLTTTVLTMTLTGVAADSALAGGHGSKLVRRGLSVAAMLLGALIGGTLVSKVDNSVPLAVAAGLLAAISFSAYSASRSTRAWTRADSER